MAKESLSAAAARGGAITMLAQLARIVIQILQVAILARLIAPESYGLIAMAVAFTGVAGILRDFGLSTAALRRTDLTQQQRSNLFWLNLAAGLGLATIVFLSSWPISQFYGENDLVMLLHWISISYILSGATAQFRVAISQQLRFRALAVCDVLPPVVALVVAICVAAAGYSLAALVSLQLVLPAVDLLCGMLLARWWPGLPRKAAGMRGLLSFGMSFAGTQLLSYVTRNIDTVIIGRLWGAAPLGMYDRAFQFSVVPINQINTPMTKVAIPVLARVGDDRKRLERGLRSAQLVACYATATGLLVAAGMAVPLIDLLLGTGWDAAAPLFAILAVSSVFRSVQQVANWLQVVRGSSRSLLVSNLIGQPIIILCILVGAIWGVAGIAWGSVLGYAFFWVFSMLWAGKHTGVNTAPLIFRAVRIMAFVGLPGGLAAWVASTYLPLSGLLLVIAALAAAVLAVFLGWAISRTTRTEIGVLVGLVRASVRKRK